MIIPYNYEETARQELLLWQEKMVREPSFASQLTKGLQDKMNGWIPEKVHQVITTAIKGMVRGVLTGSEFISGTPLEGALLEEREKLVREKIRTYKKWEPPAEPLPEPVASCLGWPIFRCC
jgi:hypothetical protein